MKKTFYLKRTIHQSLTPYSLTASLFLPSYLSNHLVSSSHFRKALNWKTIRLDCSLNTQMQVVKNLVT